MKPIARGPAQTQFSSVITGMYVCMYVCLYVSIERSIADSGCGCGCCCSSSSGSGHIDVIMGPMFAGKITSLLRRTHSHLQSRSFQVYLNKRLKGLCFSGRVIHAIGLLWRSALDVGHQTYSLLLQDCIFRKQYKHGRRIHAQMLVCGHLPNEYLKTKLLILYSKSGDIKALNSLFHSLTNKSLVSWNATIAGYVHLGLEEMGLSHYYEMRQTGLVPDQYTFASIFRACATLPTLEHGKKAHCVMIKLYATKNVIVSSALMDMYFKSCSLSDGRRVFDTTINRNVVTWTSLICGYGLHGRVREVLESFHKMKVEGFRPNHITFLAVLSACSHGGLVNEGWYYFLSMERDYGIKPRGKHYATIVDLLGRAGRLQEAYDFALNSLCKEHLAVWGSLLGACRIHGDMDLLKVVAKRYFELDPKNAGKYVVVSNAFATVGFWHNVAEVRKWMKDSEIVKEPAYSRIEVQGEGFYFLTGDKTHQQSAEIYKIMNEMSCNLEDAGSIPALSDVSS